MQVEGEQCYYSISVTENGNEIAEEKLKIMVELEDGLAQAALDLEAFAIVAELVL